MTATQRSIITELISFIESNPEYSYAEVHYSFFRPMGSKNRTDKLSDLLTITDEEILTNIEKAKIIESEG